MGQPYLVDSDADGEDARTLSPLQAAAVTCSVALGRRVSQTVLPEPHRLSSTPIPQTAAPHRSRGEAAPIWRGRIVPGSTLRSGLQIEAGQAPVDVSRRAEWAQGDGWTARSCPGSGQHGWRWLPRRALEAPR